MTALTEAERQAAYRKRRADKMARYEAALREIAYGQNLNAVSARQFIRLAHDALNGSARDDEG